MEKPADPYNLPPLGTVLITGGCGFLGSHIVSLLLAQSKDSKTSVHVVDIRPPSKEQSGATYHTADITSVDSVRLLLQAVSPNVIIHTVSPVFSSGGGASAKKFMRKVNVDGTQVLLDEAKRIGTRAFVYTSSASVISDQETDLINADETWMLIRGKAQPEYYSDTKAEAEELVLAQSARTLGEHGRPFLTAAIRPSGIFGEMDVQMIPNMLKQLRDGRTKFQLGENNNLFDFTYVGNVAHAHLLAAARLVEFSKTLEAKTTVPTEDDDDRKVDGEAFFITNGSPIYFWDFPRAVWNAYHLVRPDEKPPAAAKDIFKLSRGLSLIISSIMAAVMSLFGKSPNLTPPRVRYACMTRYFRIKKAEMCLGYAPPFTLEQGITRTVQWFADQEAQQTPTRSGSEGKKQR